MAYAGSLASLYAKKEKEWVAYILTGVEATADETLGLAKKINEAVEMMCESIRLTLPKVCMRAAKKCVD